jgi:hypothetical protein
MNKVIIFGKLCSHFVCTMELWLGYVMMLSSFQLGKQECKNFPDPSETCDSPNEFTCNDDITVDWFAI